MLAFAQAHVAGVATPHTNRPLDGFNQWDAINTIAPTKRISVVHNMPTSGYQVSNPHLILIILTSSSPHPHNPHSILSQGAIRVGNFKLLFLGMQTVDAGVHSQRQPPQGFTPAVADVSSPAMMMGYSDRIWVNYGRLWVHSDRLLVIDRSSQQA